MPYGQPWPAFLRFVGAAALSMFAGAQCVHRYYKPLSDLDAYVEEEKRLQASPMLSEQHVHIAESKQELT